MATKVFDSIKQAAGDREKSLTWYRGKVKSLMDNVTKNKLMRGKLFATPQPNGLNFFRYNPKLASILPYYDVFPLVLPIQSARGGFLGINFHYLPYALRARLLDRLERIKDSMDMDFLNRQEIEGIVEDITALQWEVNTQGIKIEVN